MRGGLKVNKVLKAISNLDRKINFRQAMHEYGGIAMMKIFCLAFHCVRAEPAG
jgi:hypothetical protein